MIHAVVGYRRRRQARFCPVIIFPALPGSIESRRPSHAVLAINTSTHTVSLRKARDSTAYCTRIDGTAGAR